MTDRAPLVKTLSVPVQGAAATATDTVMIGEAPYAGTVSEVTYTADAAVTGAASPASRTITVVNRGAAGAGTAVVATLALVGGVNLVAGDERAFTLSATAADLVVAEGDVLACVTTAVGGTGLADPGGIIAVAIARS